MTRRFKNPKKKEDLKNKTKINKKKKTTVKKE